MLRCSICGRPSGTVICEWCSNPLGAVQRQMWDSFSSLRAPLDAYSSSERQVREAFEAIGSMDALQEWITEDLHRTALIQPQLRESLGTLQSPALEALHRAMERDLQASKDLLLQGSAVADLAASVNRRSAAAWEDIQKAVESVAQLADIEWLSQRLTLDTIDEQMRALRETWDRDVRGARRGFEDLVGSIADTAAVLSASHITIHGGTLRVDGFDIRRHELEQFLAGENGLRDVSFEKLPAFAAQEKDPEKRARYVAALLLLLRNVLLPFLVSFAASKAERTWSESASQQKATVRAVRQTVERRASRAIEIGVRPQLLARYRVVTAGTLVVRAKPTRDAKPRGLLHVGDVVLYVSRAKRSWALVEWTPAGEDVRTRGWVFARHLVKLRLRSGALTDVTSNPEFAPDLIACH